MPGRTGLHIQLETYRRLAELGHVKAVKDATGDIAGAVRKRMETGLTWYSGDDGLFLPFLSVGAVGIISVIAHAASGPMRDLAAAFDRGDIHGAQRIAVQLAPLVEAMNGNGFQAVMAKASLRCVAFSTPRRCVCRTSVRARLRSSARKMACALPACCN